MFVSLLARVQSSGIAATIGQSQLITALLSAVHVLGLTLIVGSTLVSSLRLLGVVLRDRPVAEVTAGPRRGLLLGLGASTLTGFLLFTPRATTAVQNGFFQAKMLLIASAVLFSFTFYRHVARGGSSSPLQVKLAGALGLALWYGVVLAGAAFILLE